MSDEESLLGRARHLLRTRDGGRYWPTLRGSLLAEIAPVAQYQVVQRSFEHIDVRLVMRRPATVAEEEAMRSCIAGRLPVPFDITFSYPSHIERADDGNYLDFACEVDG